MTFMETANAMNSDFIECHNTLEKINLFAEASYSDYEINLKEIGLKVLKENGTEEDYNFLATEAVKDYYEKAKRGIQKIIDTIAKWLRNCKDKIVSFFTSKKTTEALDKLEEVCDNNPKIKSQKIDCEDAEKKVKALQKGIDAIKKKIAKVEAKGHATDDDLTSLEDINNDTKKKVAAISAASVITVGGAILLLKKFGSKSHVDSEVGDVEGQITMPNESAANDPNTVKFFTNAASYIGKFVESKGSAVSSAVMGLFSKLRGKTQRENVETESTNFEDLSMCKVLMECTEETTDVVDEVEEVETESTEILGNVEGLDLDAYFTELCDDLFTNKETEDTEDITDIEKTTESDTDTDVEEKVEESAETSEETSDAALYLEQLEKEILGSDEDVVEENTSDTSDAQTYIEQLEHELFGDDEDLVQESTDTNVDDDYRSLLDEMESLL